MLVKYFHKYKNIEKEKIELKKDEYLVHLRITKLRSNTKDEFKIDNIVAFYTVLSGKKIPKSWLQWRSEYSINDFNGVRQFAEYKTFIWKEEFREGFKIAGYRKGKSQTWVKIKTPEGWEVEISLSNFLDLLNKNKITVDNGKLVGKYKIKVLNAKGEIKLVKD